MRRALNRAAAVLTALLIVIGAWTVQAPAASAAVAATCPSVRGSSNVEVPARVLKSPRAAVHNGPAAACRVTDYVPYGTTIYKTCSWMNLSTGNWWTLTNWGWIYEGYLDGNLARPCG
ncbi:hypothetical protein [Plantactinospora soyae]|uniref:SH3 domain-containing protein n=1 Tax=Plantactinospora soyae TaxID=1544732 RepID=A0A927M0R1_9ACTN|nr:hypothetical protein [Plantactinospora soyae]MBE1484662.1 hypothetical protein [Plantactinospora soyae]